MKHKKSRKFKKIREKFWKGASSSLLAGLVFFGANTTISDSLVDYRSSQYEQVYSKSKKTYIARRWNSSQKIGTLARELGLDSSTVRNELKSGKTLKQILQDYNIDAGDVQMAFDAKKA